MDKIGIGIIGLGAIGERLINSFNKHERSNIVGVFDTDIKRMDYISRKYNLLVVDDYNSLINNDDIEMIYIAVPPKFHHEIALKVMKAGKHIFCEKPLAGTIDEAKEMYELSKKVNVVNGMNFPLHHSFAYKKIKNMLNNNELGDIKRVEISALFPVWPRTWQENKWIDTKDQGGFVREVFTHFIQLTIALFGEIKNIKSFVEYPDNPLKSESGIVALANLKNNIKVTFNGITDVDQEEAIKFIIYGSKGSVEMLNWRDLFINNSELGRCFVEPDESNATYDLIDMFFNAIDGEESNLATFEDGYNTTIVVEKLLEI